MTPLDAHRTTTRVGLTTALIGAALVAAPGPVGSFIGLTDRRHASVLGAVDLALVPGLLAGRPRWPWLVARAVYNVAIAVDAVDLARRNGGRRRAAAFATFLAVATVGDTRAVLGLLNDR